MHINKVNNNIEINKELVGNEISSKLFSKNLGKFHVLSFVF